MPQLGTKPSSPPGSVSNVRPTNTACSAEMTKKPVTRKLMGSLTNSSVMRCV
jgi:hypothetical protein